VSNKRPDILTEDLQREYCDLNMTGIKIASSHNITPAAVYKRLQNIGIQRRSASDARKGRKAKRKYDITKADLEHKYVELNMTMQEIAMDYGYLNGGSVCQYLAEYGIPRRTGSEVGIVGVYKDLRNKVSQEELRYKYWGLGMTSEEMGKEYGCTDGFVLTIMEEHNVPRRSQAEASGICGKKCAATWVAKNKARWGNQYDKLPDGIPEAGTVIDGRLLGFRHGAYMWHYCSSCGEGRWILTSNLEMSITSGVCKSCTVKLEDVLRKNKEGQKRAAVAKSAKAKKWWANMTPQVRADFVSKQRINRLVRPTGPETLMLELLQSLYPSQWKYVGDGQVVIENRNPDFINVNGQKAIIEVFGDFWHSKQVTGKWQWEGVMARKHLYSKYGFKLLVIWENELKNMERVKTKVIKFCNGLHKATFASALFLNTGVAQGNGIVVREPLLQRQHISTEDLRRDYCDLKMTTTEVGNKYGISASTVANRLKAVGIPMRTLGEALKGRKYTVRKDIDTNDLQHDYCILKMSSLEIAKKYGVSVSMVSRRLRKMGVVLDNALIHVSEEELRYKYLELHMAQETIAKEHGCSETVIRKWLVRYDIPIRQYIGKRQGRMFLAHRKEAR